MKMNKNPAVFLASALLAASLLLPLVSCGGARGTTDGKTSENTVETESEAMSESEKTTEQSTQTPAEEISIIRPESGFLADHGDCDKAENWLRENIVNTDTPPVTFTIGQKKSGDLLWEKSVGEAVTVVDYPASEAPAQRSVREIEYLCDKEGLKLTLTLTLYPGYPVVEYDAVLTNISGQTTEVLKNLSSVDTELSAPDAEQVLHYNQGSHAYGESSSDYQPKSALLKKSATRIGTSEGLPTDAYLPYFNVESAGGGGVILAVNWQGNWSAEFKHDSGALQMKAGQAGLSSVMLPEEHFKLPGTVLLFYRGGDRQYGQNIWRRWIVQHNLLRNTGSRDFRQNVFCCSDFSGAARDIANVRNLAARGLTEKYNCVYEFDAGWYKGSNSDWYTAVGNWTPQGAYSNGKLKQVSDACHENGMLFCMWMEPERLYSNSEAARQLADSAIYLGTGSAYVPYSEVKGKTMGLINYGKKEAQDFVVNLVSNAVKEYGMDVYRQDFNTESGKFWKAYDRYEQKLYEASRSGATENHACEGYISAWTRIEEENPGLIFDACAGGGRRYDLETLRFAFMHTKSDYWADVASQQGQNYGVSSWNIFTGTGFADPTDLYDVRSRLTLSIGIGAAGADETTDSSLAEWASLQKYMYGDFFGLGAYSLKKSDNLAVQFCDIEKGEGMLAAYLRAGGEYAVKPMALEETQEYKVWDKDDPDTVRVMTGQTLMQDGWLASAPAGTRAAVVLFYEKNN